MKIVAMTDLHGNTSGIDEAGDVLAAADVVLLTGDLTNFGGRRDAARVLNALREHNDSVLAVHGNCDRPDVADYLSEEGISLHARSVERDGVVLLGLGGSLPAPAGTPSEYDEDELAAFLQQAARGADDSLPWVVVSHQPAADTALDRVRGGRHVGSRSVRTFIEEHEPLVCFSGHIHEADGTDAIGPTKLINPGPLRHGGYAWAVVEDGLRELEVRRL
ncbi:MAG: metallophosphoesterase family protein [Candidatus Brocadiia bacterium]